MNPYNPTIISEDVNYDDDQLITSFLESEEKMLNNKIRLSAKLKAADEHNYLDVYLARLAYEFAKEEHELLFNEVLKRRLITGIGKGA